MGMLLHEGASKNRSVGVVVGDANGLHYRILSILHVVWQKINFSWDLNFLDMIHPLKMLVGLFMFFLKINLYDMFFCLYPTCCLGPEKTLCNTLGGCERPGRHMGFGKVIYHHRDFIFWIGCCIYSYLRRSLFEGAMQGNYIGGLWDFQHFEVRCFVMKFP